MTADQVDQELAAAAARLHEETMAAIRAARAAVDEFTAKRHRRIRCPVCDRPTIVVRGVVVRHEAHDTDPFYCPGSGAPAPPEAKGGK